MARCMLCHHCGGCGPGSGGGGALNPPGWCVFCQTQNDAGAFVCGCCGKPLPRPAGDRMSEAAKAASKTGADHEHR